MYSNAMKLRLGSVELISQKKQKMVIKDISIEPYNIAEDKGHCFICQFFAVSDPPTNVGLFRNHHCATGSVEAAKHTRAT